MSLAIVPAVWIAHFLAVYALVSVACATAAEAIVVPGIAAATLAALACFAWFGLRNFRAWRAAQEGPAFVAQTNLLLAALSAVATLWVAYPAFLLPPCAS